MKISRGTTPNKCYWCKKYGEVKFIKVTPKKEKPACLTCHEMMTTKPDQLEIHPIFSQIINSIFKI
jgi:hypothetical protein